MREMTFNEMRQIQGGELTEGDVCRMMGYVSAAVVSFYATPIGGLIWSWGYDQLVKCPD